MKTSELIAKLQELDPSGEMEVVTYEYEGQTSCDLVSNIDADTMYFRTWPDGRISVYDAPCQERDIETKVILIG